MIANFPPASNLPPLALRNRSSALPRGEGHQLTGEIVLLGQGPAPAFGVRP